MREREFIDWIRRQTKFDPEAVPIGPGDDCAAVNFGDEQILITTDQVLDGVHLVLAEHGPYAAGRKAMARNLSDIAAMAAVPVAAVAAVALPKGFSTGDAEAIYTGLRELGDEFNCPIVGGDVAVWAGPLAITVTIFGRRSGAGSIPIRRDGAEVGDAVCVTGQLGGAWRSGRHLEFTPRITEATQLAADYSLHAMIDISDGLAADLGQICAAAGVAAEINADDIPVHPDASRLAADPAAALQAALSDGEDYELLFVLPPAQASMLCERQPLPVKVTNIGRIVPGDGIALVHGDGSRRKLEASGWEHTTQGDL